MGNHRFRLSDIIPNAWFHKLKVMTRGSRSPTLHGATKKAHHPIRAGSTSTPTLMPSPPYPPAEQPYLQPRRASYYFPSRQEKTPGSPIHPRASDTLFPVDPPRKSKKMVRRKQARPSNKPVSSVSAGSWSCRGSVWEGDVSPPCREEGPDDDDDGGVPCFDKLIIAEHYDNCNSVAAWSRSCSCKVVSPANVDVVMDVGRSNSSSTVKHEELSLPPIHTKPAKKGAEPTQLDDDRRNHLNSQAKNHHKSRSLPPLKDCQRSSPRKPSTPIVHGLRLRAPSPRLASKKLRAHRSGKTTASTPRKCLSESFAVVKSSSDPHRDFRDSMMEMIAENNIRASTDLEELLACYLSLNSNEYHDVIVKVFEQIWFDLTDARCREVPRSSSRQ